MLRKLSPLLLFILLFGCGFNADEPVYDTATNPDGFPQMALTTLEQIESGQLQGFDAIAGGFGDLYTEHTDLLDSEPWRAVIDRLGSKFGHIADSLRGKGVASFLNASEYYQLASFARPQDKQLYQRASTFETWRQAFENADIDLASLVDGTDPQLAKYLSAARYFVFGGEAHRDFFDGNLRIAFEDRLKQAGQLSSAKMSELNTTDLCLARYLDLTDEPVDESLASFENPSIDLVACRITQLAPSKFVAEVYLVPHEKISGELTVAVRMSLPDSLNATAMPGLNYSQLQLKPEEPSSDWKPGQILAAYRQFDFAEAPSSLQIGLIDRSEGRAKYLEMSDDGGSFLRINSPAPTAL
ncbi:MAG: hypothetical protein GY867_11070 [bacterium]|nr:hypothetical protein [bacterium]